MRILKVTDTHNIDESTEATHRAFWRDVKEKEQFDAILHTGDWGRTELIHVRESFRVTREENPNIPIWSIYGNHDLWSTQKSLSLESRFKALESYALNYGIDIVERNPVELESFWIVGLMGWYKNAQTPTRDREYLPTFTTEGTPYVWLQKYAEQSMNEIMNLDFKGKKVLFVSHFPLVKEIMGRVDLSGNERMGELVLSMADIYCYGHSHKTVDTTVGKTRILNAGAEYDQTPKYIIFELK